MLAPDEYPVLGEMAALALPLRTTLYRLEPIGIGTGARESLTSYVERLADAHCISPHFLAEVPAVDEIARATFRSGVALWAPYFNSGGVTSVQWAAALGRLTGCAGLEGLTLAPVAKVVNQWNLVAREKRWCPECLRQAELAGVPCAQLLWEIGCVTACPLHEIEITGQCSCHLAHDKPCRAKRSPGCCPRCGRGLAETLPRLKARAEEVRIARVAYDLLAATRFDQGGWCPSDNRSGEFLRSVAAIHFGGNAAWLAKSLGVSKSSLHEWMEGDHRPSLTWLMALADRLGCSVVDILDARAGTTHPPDGCIVRQRKNTRLSVASTQREKLAEQLASALSNPIASSLHAVAVRLQVNSDFLRKYFPKQSTAIVARFRAAQTAQKLAKKGTLLTAIRVSAERLAAQGIWPTSRRIQEGMAFRARYSNLRPEMNQVLADVRQRMGDSLSGISRRRRKGRSGFDERSRA